jgi:hypothetical protein
MKDPRMLGIRLPSDVRNWIATQAGLRKMTLTDYTIQLIAKGIQAETIDETVDRLRAASETGVAREMLRQTMAIRYIVEAQARGTIRHPETLGTEALMWADRELDRLFPKGDKL